MSGSKVEKVIAPESIRWIEGKEKGQTYFRGAWSRALDEARRDLLRRKTRRRDGRDAQGTWAG